MKDNVPGGRYWEPGNENDGMTDAEREAEWEAFEAWIAEGNDLIDWIPEEWFEPERTRQEGAR